MVEAIFDKIPAVADPLARPDEEEDGFSYPIKTAILLNDLESRLAKDISFQRNTVSVYSKYIPFNTKLLIYISLLTIYFM